MKPLTLIAVLLLAGCGSMKYSHPYKSTTAELQRDLRECEMKYQAGHYSMALVAAQNAWDCVELEKGWVKQ